MSYSSNVSSHSGQRTEQEQEAGVAVPLQEEVGLSGGASTNRGGEDRVASARPSRVQTQEILPLRECGLQGRFPTPSQFVLKFIHIYAHVCTKLSICVYLLSADTHTGTCTPTHTHLKALTFNIGSVIFKLTVEVFPEAFRFLRMLLNVSYHASCLTFLHDLRPLAL